MMSNIRSMIERFWSASIRRQLIVGIALVHAVLMTIFVVDLVDRQSQFLHEQSFAQAEGLAKTLASSSTSWVLANDIAGLDEVLQSQSSFPGLRYAMVVSPRGKVIAHTDKTKRNLYFSDDISRRLLNSEFHAQTLLANNMLVDVAYPIVIDDELIGWARVGIGQEKIAAGLGKISLNGIIYTAIAILAGSIFAYFMARNLTGGLRHLIRVAEGNRQGQRELRADLQRQDEIGQLGRDFNLMLEALLKQDQALREHETEMRKITDVLPGPVARVDKNGRYLFVSAAYERWFGKRPVDVVGHTQKDSVSTAHYEKVAPYFKRALAGENVTFEISVNAPSGEVLYGQVNALPDYNATGEVCGFFVIVADITGRKQAEEAIAESRNLLMTIIDTLPMRVFWKDRDLRYLGCNLAFANDAGMVYAKDVIGKDDYQMGWAAQADFYRADDRAVMETGIAKLFYDEPQVTPTGKKIWIRTSKVPLTNPKHEIIGILGLYEDITEYKQAEQTTQILRDQLVQATKMEAVGHLTAGIAHDFNNMLGAIMGYTELSKHLTTTGSPEKISGYLDEILKASNRAKELIAQMLTFSRLAPDTPGEKVPATILTPVIKEVVSLLRSSIPSTIELNYQIEDENLKALILPINLHQIILNLGINARDAIGEYGKINITLARERYASQACDSCQHDFEGEFVKLTVSDTGTGIDLHILKNIFNPFFTTKGVGKGTGMGLSVVHGLIHALGGHIRVESVPGKGTAISVLLPLALSAADDEPYTAVQENTGGTLAGLRIMVVDDELFMTAVLQEFLSMHGARITAFNSPLAAWTAFEEQPENVDLVITDETMPGLSGMHLAELMLKLRPGLPVILCTGYSDHATPELAKQAGLAGFFYKPLKMSELIQKIRLVV